MTGDRFTGETLSLALSAAVPLEIADLARATDTGRVALGRRCADVIAAHGDDLQYGGKHCRAAFAAVVKGLAAGAYQPGGIALAGTLWCAAHHRFGARIAWPCPACVADETGRPATTPRVATTIEVAGGLL